MKVDVSYASDCPSRPATVRLVKYVLAAEGVATDDIHEVLVRDKGMAGEFRFVGSPTTRINGRDVSGELQTAKNFALSCRLYPGSKQIGLPPKELVDCAMMEAWQGESE